MDIEVRRITVNCGSIEVKDLKELDSLYSEGAIDEEIKTLEEFEKNLDNIEKIKRWEAAEQRMEIIGQNGNDGDHYSKLDLNQDGEIDKIDKEIAQRRINEIQNILNTSSLTQETKNNLTKEKKLLENKLDELTKIY